MVDRWTQTVQIDLKPLRSHLLDMCGTALFAGFGPAVLDTPDIELAVGEELLRMALCFGVDPAEFEFVR